MDRLTKRRGGSFVRKSRYLCMGSCCCCCSRPPQTTRLIWIMPPQIYLLPKGNFFSFFSFFSRDTRRKILTQSRLIGEKKKPRTSFSTYMCSHYVCVWVTAGGQWRNQALLSSLTSGSIIEWMQREFFRFASRSLRRILFPPGEKILEQRALTLTTKRPADRG